MPEPFMCPLCGGDTCSPEQHLQDRVMRTTEKTFTLVRCSGCGLLRLHPLPDAETLARSYASDYAPHVRPGVSGRAKGVLERRSVRLLQEHLKSPLRVLDVGCATGDLLLAVRAAGNPNVTGVETSDDASNVARKRGLDVRTGELHEVAFPPGSFDTVLVSHTLEHVADPVVFLSEVQRILSPGGSLLIWIPNADSLEATVFRRFWIGYDAPRHLTTFTTGTLGRALAQAGFIVQDVRHEAVGLEWAWGIRLALRERVPAVDALLQKLHPLLIVILTPLSLAASRFRRSGRIRVVARSNTT